MKYKGLKIFSSLLLVSVLSSCGYGLSETYAGDAYNSTVFQENYYREWNKAIDENNENNSIVETTSRNLSYSRDSTFTSYYDEIVTSVDEDTATLAYEKDLYSKSKPDYYLGTGYGPTKKLSRTEDSFKYGYVSKLFDGQMFCWGYYQQSRIQMDGDGFGFLFDKEGTPSDDAYFALNFKASYDYTTTGQYDFNYDGVIDEDETINDLYKVLDDGSVLTKSNLTTSVNFTVSFYCKTDDGYTKKSFTYEVTDMRTNATENTSIYKFFGFKLSNCFLSRIAGISFEYEMTYDPFEDLLDIDGEYGTLDYSLMLYECFLPNVSWS